MTEARNDVFSGLELENLEGGRIFPGGGMSKFFGGGDSPHPSSRKNPSFVYH